MALPDIINAITVEAEAELAAIAAERDNDIAAIKAALEAHVTSRTTAAAHDRARRADKVAERILAKARHHATFITTGAVQAELDAVFAAVTAQLTTLDTATYKTYLEKQWASLPTTDATTGAFLVATERSTDTNTFLVEKGIATNRISSAPGLLGGFVLVTPTREYDCSFCGLIAQLENTQRVAVSQQLAAAK